MVICVNACSDDASHSRRDSQTDKTSLDLESVAEAMTSIIFDDERRLDDYTSSRLMRFSAGPADAYARPPPHYQQSSDAGARADNRAYSDAASCGSSRSPGVGVPACSCRAGAESPPTPADGPPSRYFEHRRHHHHHHHEVLNKT